MPPYPLSGDGNHGDGDDDEEAEARDGLGNLSLDPPLPKHRRFLQSSSAKAPDPALSPLSASTHFAQAIQVSVPLSDLDFRVYITPPTVATDGNGKYGSIIVCHHGAGYSALSFACLAKEVVQSTSGECGIMAFDARAHGKTTSISNPGLDPPELDLSLSNLTNDFLVGHSMGGAVVTNASGKLIEKGYSLCGVAVLDVVEGSAIEALPHMHTLLASRVEGFASPEDAIAWHTTGHTGSTIRNVFSARLSVPSLIVPSTPDEISAGIPQWKWRTPLKSTAPYWESWFAGLSKSFLATRTARLLVLAGTDRLDRELMIGQMQGKFQLIVVPDVGHMLHEDDPGRIAEILVEFWKRNDRPILPGIKKVGER
ncbi:hypothetical protein BS47DRAFT_1394141 [Hydnum rufescens UP504]|uniref:Protein phosphatase methylesterase 1 n=1 Tax=Hydnum rufescens UP504 TaxID=1448309 RepID=A0A9P6DVC9_9AGAM|nr:hypothetical protein BS47DRAFT_1394141 [Hydnum rufescens UP504]